MSLSVYIIDDEFHAVELLTRFVQRTHGLLLAGSATDPQVGLEQITTVPEPQLTLLDVDMPGLSGLEIAALVSGRTQVAFTTSSRNFGPEAFALSLTDYLLKPISYERFLQCIQKAKIRLHPKEDVRSAAPHSFYVKTNTKGKLLRVMSADILYIKSDRNYVDIFLPGRVITAYLTLGDLAGNLPPHQFVRVHRSYIVNLEKIKALEPGHIRLSDETLVELGKSYRESLMNLLSGQVLSSSRERNA